VERARRSPRHPVVLLPALLAGALAAACGGGGSKAPPPGIVAVVIGFPGGGAPPGFEGAVVEVVDVDTGEPRSDATVVVNGLTLPWSPLSQDYQGSFAVPAGSAVTVAVTRGGTTWRTSATFFTEPPAISLPSPPVWPSGCDNLLAWSGGQPVGTSQTLLAFLDAADPGGEPLVGPFPAAPGAGEITIGATSLSPGARIAFVGTSSSTPVPGAAAGSVLVLVNGATAPLTVADADFREILVQPADRGIGTGEQLPLQATAPLCAAFGSRDVTALAAWSTSDAAVAQVGTAPGPAGVVTGAGPGVATVTAEVGGLRGATAVGVRDFTARDSGAPGELLGGVAWTGTRLVAVGTSGTVLSSPDGATWTAHPTGTTAQLTGVAGSPGLVAAVMYGSATVLTSPDLVDWTPRDAGPTAASGLWSVAWTGSQFVAAGIGGAVVTSPDGLAWTGRASGTPYTLAGVTGGGPRLVAVGGIGGLVGQVVTSPDGATWTALDLPPAAGYLQDVAWTGSQYLAVGDFGPMASPDGVTWTSRPGPAGLRAIAASPTGVMAVGSSGAVVTSSDGQRWITWKVGDALLEGVAWTGDRWVMVGANGTILTTP
jgi:hypothetical protein